MGRQRKGSAAEQELRVLILEDVATDAELCERELRRAGLKFTAQRVDTQQAFERALGEFRPDIILSDFSMPAPFDGLAALDLARAKLADVPFVFVSGTIGEDRAVEAMKRGATDYVLKDRLDRLVPVVRRAIQEAQESAARRRAEQELEETRERLNSIVSSLRDVVWSYSPREERLLYVSAAVEEVFGRPVADFYGNPNRWLEMVHPEDRARVRAIRKAGLLTRRFESVYRIVLPDGGIRWIQDRVWVLTGADGAPLRMDGLARDITESKLQEVKIVRLSRVLAVLSGINSAIVRIRDRQKLFYEACRIAVEHGNFGLAWIGLFDPATLDVTPVAWTGLGWDEFNRTKSSARADVPLGQGVVGRAIRERKPVFDNDISASPGVAGKRRQEALQLGYRSLIALPLFAEDAVAGILALFVKEPNFFDAEEVKLLTELAGDISFALEHMAGQQKLEKLSRIRAVSGGINAAIVRIRERESLLQETCRIASEQGKFEMVWIGALDPEKQEVRPVAWTGFSPEAAHAVSWASISAARGTLGEAILTRRPAVRNDIEAELPTGKLRQEALKADCRSTVCLPLVVDDKVVALIVLFAAGRGFFDEDELALLNELAADVSFALQSISRQEKLNYLVYYDALTGLPNRTLFHERVTQLIHSSGPNGTGVAVMLLDLERFRNINETLGVGAGDALLKQVAERLSQVIGEQGTVARIGGDHFAVALGGVHGEAQIAHLLEQRILAVLNQPFPVAGHELRIPAKAGIAVYPDDGNDAAALFANAEAALSKAKQSGDRFLFYASQMNARVAEHLKLENELRRAVLEEQFVLHYQPRVELGSGRISGLEALIRWLHPERGLVPPGEFIPILEGTGLILEAGRWALKRAALDHVAWRKAGLKPPRIAVNVSAIQLRRKDFVEDVRTALAPAGGSGEHIDIEITESMLMDDIEGNIAKLEAIQAMGVQTAMDDFGTGYSSLGYLAKLPLNSLKIDRSFVSQMAKGPEQMAMVSTVISLARALNLKVVAEGVETEEQANLLRLLRCDEAQGFLFHRPLPPAEVERLIT